MTKIDYKTLETEDLLSLARKIFEVASEDVDSAYDKISAEIDRILEKEKDSDKNEDLFLTADQLTKELQRRYNEGWGLIEKKAEDEKQAKSGDCQNRYFIDFNVDKGGFDGDDRVKGSDFLFKDDEKKEIPDEQLLKDRPFEWLAKYLKSNVYEERDPYEIELDPDDYDEGFDE